VVDDSELHVEANIDEADIGRVKSTARGAQARCAPDHPVPGLVSKLDPPFARTKRGRELCALKSLFTNLAKAVEAGIRPGMSANVDVQVLKS